MLSVVKWGSFLIMFLLTVIEFKINLPKENRLEYVVGKATSYSIIIGAGVAFTTFLHFIFGGESWLLLFVLSL